jgi:chromosomal replication initiator protein
MEHLRIYSSLVGKTKMGGDATLYSDVPEDVRSAAERLEALESNTTFIWKKCTAALEETLDKQIFTAWIKPLTIASIDHSGTTGVSVTLFAPNKFCCDHVQRHYGDLISDELCAALDSKETTISLKVSKEQAPQKPKESSNLEKTLYQAKRHQQRNESAFKPAEKKQSSNYSRPTVSSSRTRAKQPQDIDETNLNPKYNFSNYIVGGCNQFAQAACLKVSENPGHAYNPLFLYGGVGLGKTHLANAIGNAARRRNKKTLVISSETFVSELISSLKTNNMDRFKSKFRSLDLLIVDDIQFIIGKERTQEEFFHTFNELYMRHKQIVITSDKVPQELVGLEERLRTRFACGLSADLQAPDFETRVAILNKKSESGGMFLPDEVARMIAERIDTNVRELEGALNRLQALCALHEAEANVGLADEVLKSIAPEKLREVTTEAIQRTVASRFNVSVNDILGKRRTHNIAFARQVAMFLSRRLTGCSYPELGALFGGRDHSTVIHAKKVITERIKRDPSFEAEVRELERKLTS